MQIKPLSEAQLGERIAAVGLRTTRLDGIATLVDVINKQVTSEHCPVHCQQRPSGNHNLPRIMAHARSPLERGRHIKHKASVSVKQSQTDARRSQSHQLIGARHIQHTLRGPNNSPTIVQVVVGQWLAHDEAKEGSHGEQLAWRSFDTSRTQHENERCIMNWSTAKGPIGPQPTMAPINDSL